MNRREGFERWWADRNDVPVDTMEQYRCDDERQYRLPEMARKYRVWCAALDSVIVQVPDLINCGEDMGCAFVAAIEAAGVKVV